MSRGLPLRSQAGELLDEEEAERQRELLSGMVVPDFEVCPSFTVDEVLEIEAGGSTVWWRLAECEEVRRRHLRLFVTMLVDTLRRDGDVNSFPMLWNSVCAAEPSYEDVVGPACSMEVVVVTIILIFLK